MADVKVEVLPGPFLQLGEAPHWDVESQSLYYVCILGSTLHRYDWKENQTYTAKLEGSTYASFIIPVSGRQGEFVVGSGTRLLLVAWDGLAPTATIVKVLTDLGEEEADHRFNDGKVDGQGRLYAGTMLAEDSRNHFEMDDGKFYRFDAGRGQMVPLKSKVHISNGLTWSARQPAKLYYIDSFAFDIKAYTVDAEGNLGGETVLIKLKDDEAATEFIADGMTSDAEGDLYVAVFAGSKIIKINPESAKIVQEIALPVAQVTSVAFGGPNLDVLFATTAAKEISIPQEPPAGAVLKITGLGARGLPMNELQLP
ncbi:regucalcin-like isoform X1 [Anopheles stephensi]|uniref:regucalcin-like isoform X1 n=1 Tax=Anopheles stephensi TaxID=30069 RepID=UPI0016587DD0|nr:regucalcin-like isoform X1 [Anopheles stephensi]